MALVKYRWFSAKSRVMWPGSILINISIQSLSTIAGLQDLSQISRSKIPLLDWLNHYEYYSQPWQHFSKWHISFLLTVQHWFLFLFWINKIWNDENESYFSLFLLFLYEYLKFTIHTWIVKMHGNDTFQNMYIYINFQLSENSHLFKHYLLFQYNIQEKHIVLISFK